MKLSHEQKISIVSRLNWDYNATPEELLSVIEGRNSNASAFTREKLFVRCLESCSWLEIAPLWGIEECVALYTPEISRRLFPKSLRRQYDNFFATLRGEFVSAECEFENIKWIAPPDWEMFCAHRRQMIQDICWLRDNSLIK